MIYRYPFAAYAPRKIGQINYSRLTKRRQFLGILGPICLLAGYLSRLIFGIVTGIVYKQLNDSLISRFDDYYIDAFYHFGSLWWELFIFPLYHVFYHSLI